MRRIWHSASIFLHSRISSSGRSRAGSSNRVLYSNACCNRSRANSSSRTSSPESAPERRGTPRATDRPCHLPMQYRLALIASLARSMTTLGSSQWDSRASATTWNAKVRARTSRRALADDDDAVSPASRPSRESRVHRFQRPVPALSRLRRRSDSGFRSAHVWIPRIWASSSPARLRSSRSLRKPDSFPCSSSQNAANAHTSSVQLRFRFTDGSFRKNVSVAGKESGPGPRTQNSFASFLGARAAMRAVCCGGHGGRGGPGSYNVVDASDSNLRMLSSPTTD